MHFSTFVVFQIVLAIGFHSVEAKCEKMEEMRKVMCNDEKKEKKDEIMECVKKVEFKEYEDLVMPCADGLESMEPEVMVEYWCAKEDEEAITVMKCIDEKVNESGKKDEIKAKGEPIQKCMEEKFGKKEKKEE